MNKNNNFETAVFLLFASLFFVLLASCSSSNDQSSYNSTSHENYNQADLNNYGEWVQTNNLGNVWHPYAVNEWTPFENGHWSYADGNWTWISYEPFGWIVYHYGNWYDDPYKGWVWVPSNDPWSPARVTWIDYNDYVGWAPLPPAGIAYGNPWERNENRHWHVVRQRDFTKDNIRNYRVNNPERNTTANSTVIRRAPGKGDIEKSRGTIILEVKIPQTTVSTPVRAIKKMNLPPQEDKRVQQNSPRVKNEVLIPQKEFEKKQSDKKQDPQKDVRKK